MEENFKQLNDGFDFLIDEPATRGLDDFINSQETKVDETTIVDKTKEVKKEKPKEIEEDLSDIDFDNVVDLTDASGNKKVDAGDSKPRGKDDKPKDIPEDSVFKILGESFKAKGILDLPEDFDGSEEGFEKAQATTIDNRVDAEIQAFADSLPEEGKQVLDFIRNGGKVADYLEMTSGSVENLDPENEAHQKEILKRFYRMTSPNLSDERINTKAENILKLGLQDEITDAHEQMKAYEAENKAALVEQTKRQTLEVRQKQEESKQEIIDFIIKSETIKGILPIKDSKTKSQFIDYLLKPSVQLKDGRKVSPHFIALQKEQGDIETWLFNAYNRFTNYSTKSIEDAIKTKTVTSLTDKLKQSSDSYLTKLKNNGEEDRSPAKRDKQETKSAWDLLKR